MTFGKRLMGIRLALPRQTSQREFGESLGTTGDAIAAYENDKCMPSETFIRLLCFKFSVNEIWLRSGRGSMFSKSKNIVIENIDNLENIDDEDRRIVTAYLTSPPEVRKVFKDIIRKLGDIYNSKNNTSVSSNSQIKEESSQDQPEDTAERAKRHAEIEAMLDAYEERLRVKKVLTSVYTDANGNGDGIA